MKVLIHGSEDLESEVRTAFEGYPFIEVMAPDSGPVHSGALVHLAEHADHLPEAIRGGAAPTIVLSAEPAPVGVILCPRESSGALPRSLFMLMGIMGSEEFGLRNRVQELISVFHHDISEPARNMSFFAQFLNSDRNIDEAKRKDLLGRIHVSGERLQRLVADLTRYARIWAKPTPSQSLTADEVGEICKKAFESAKKQRDCLLEDLELCQVHGVRAPSAHLAVIFHELFANALEFRGEADGSIQLTAHRDPESQQVQFCVLDHGPGIVDPGEGRLFRPFYRGKRDDELRTGIGLALVRAMVEEAGGKVWVEEKRDLDTVQVHFSLPEA